MGETNVGTFYCNFIVKFLMKERQGENIYLKLTPQKKNMFIN